jgi:GntR family transcriptional regulator
MTDRLDRTRSKPLYKQLAEILRERICSAAIARGNPIGSQSELAETFEVRPAVVDRALEVLLAEGWVECDRGREYLASEPSPPSGVVLGWDPADLGFEIDGDIEIRVLSKVMTTLSPGLLGIFEVHGKEGRRANRVLKLYLAGGQPISIEAIVAPTSSLPGLLMKDHRRENVYRMIQAHYGCRIVKVEQRSTVRGLSKEEASTLRSVEDFPALCMARVLFGEEGALAAIDWVVPGGRCGLIEEAKALPGWGDVPNSK